MIYIEKKRIRSDIEKHVIEIQAMEDWKNLEDGNAEKNRYYFDLLDKTALRESLVEEQHGLCAYCMRRIRSDKTMKIEHCIPIKNKNESLIFKFTWGL